MAIRGEGASYGGRCASGGRQERRDLADLVAEVLILGMERSVPKASLPSSYLLDCLVNVE